MRSATASTACGGVGLESTETVTVPVAMRSGPSDTSTAVSYTHLDVYKRQGVAFNGPDVGGFMDDVSAELLVRWHQAGCLFPFYRNHSAHFTRRQEPWQFESAPLAAIRGAIRTRYRLLPYLYQCFFAHWRDGDPVIRPLLYHYPQPDYAHLNDCLLYTSRCV